MNWNEFNGYAHERVAGDKKKILVARLESYGWFMEVASASILDGNGWHRGRNERFSHWLEITEPLVR